MATSRITSNTFVAAPAAVVFAIVADPRQHPRIDGSGMVRGSITGPDRLELGSRFRMDMRQGAPYKITNKVVEHEPDRLIAWRHIGKHRWRYELEPTTVDGTSGTRVTETWDLAAYPGLVQRGLMAIFGRGTRSAIDATLVKLKAAAEADTTAPS